MHESSLHCRWRARGPCGDGSTDCRNGSGGNPRSHGDAYIGGQRIAVRSARRVLATGDVLHGGPDFDMSYLLPELDRLANSYRLIYHDQRGRGRSADGVRAEDVKLGSEIDDIEQVRRRFRLDTISWPSCGGSALRHWPSPATTISSCWRLPVISRRHCRPGSSLS